MRNYKINFFKRIREVVPPTMKGQSNSNWQTGGLLNWITAGNLTWDTNEDSIILAWLECMVQPLKQLNEQFLAYVENVRFLLNLTGQRIYMEEYLNRLFDSAYRRITIIEGNPRERVYLFRKSEGQTPTYLFRKSEGQPPVYLFRKGEYATEYDFIVCIPEDINTPSLVEQISSVVNDYKAAGMRFNITTC